MRKILQTLILFILLVLPFSLNARASDTVSINQLVENAKAMDGREVTVQGEAIGEMLARGDYCWVNINDGTNAIGIWMKTADARSITRYGDYKNKGDTVRVTGTFRRACAEHGGEADLHSRTMEVIQAGGSLPEQIPAGKITAAVLLAIFAALLFVYYKSRKNASASRRQN